MKTAELFKVFREPKRVRALVEEIKAKGEDPKGRPVHIMEFCGGHTHSIVKHGIDTLLDGYVRFVHGPGCPVCVLSQRRIDLAIELAKSGVILCTYGDVLRVPGSLRQSLLDMKAQGCDVRMVYSCLECLDIAGQNPGREVVFFAIGFETTTPQTAVLILKARQMGLKNLSVVCNHVLTPSAIQHILNAPEMREYGRARIDAFIGPGHVSTIIGTKPYEYFVEEFRKPVAISGFEPVDILRAVLALLEQLKTGAYRVENCYQRFVSREGNKRAQELVSQVFELRKSFEWRGLGKIPYSALRVRKEYKEFDAEERFSVKLPQPKEVKGCICGAVLRGIKSPTDCGLFGTVCTPKNPLGSCMVSSEGACNAYYRYRL